jgi:hypothetical protein
MSRRATTWKTIGAATLALALALPSASEAQPVQAGVSSAVSGSVDRASPAIPRPKAPLAVGDDILMRDEIASGVQSVAQLLLRDESTFTIGPESEVLIDEFVYDPGSGTGRLAASALKGVFRFVSGRIGATIPQNISIKTPNAVIGVRGTMLLVDVVRDAVGAVTEELVVLTGPGARNNARQKPGLIKVSAAGVTVPISRTGWGTYVRPGQPPTDPAPIPLDVIARLNGRLSPKAIERATAADAEARSAVSEAGISDISGQDLALATARADVTLEVAAGQDLLTDQIAGSELNDPAQTPLSDALFSITTIDQLLALPPGTATYSVASQPLFDSAVVDSFINDQLSSSSGSSIGSYDFGATVNLGTRSYTVAFTSITVPSLGLFGGSLIDSDSFADDVGLALTFLDSDSFGNAACMSVGCFGAAALLTVNGDSTAQAIHVLSVGFDDEVLGGGITSRK